MTRRWLFVFLLLLCPFATGAEVAPGSDPAPAAETVATLRAGDSTLRIQLVGVPGRARREELQRWAKEAAEAALSAFGRFPLRAATVRIEQSPSHASSPVPWGQTLRRDGVAVLLFVRENATVEELRADWTAVHELSHLFHPYLGGEGRWLAEGLASYYQNVLRARAGLLDEAEAWRRLDAGFGGGRREASGLPLREISRRHRGTMRVYWAGAAFWLEADLALRRRGSSLDAVLSEYSRCCLRGTGYVAPRAFVARLDEVAGHAVFEPLYERYADSTAFPPLDAAYTTLGLESRADELHFFARGARLRAAVMGRRASTKLQ